LEEQTIYKRKVNTPSAITHWWFAGSPVENAIIRFYVDGEVVPSVQVQLDLSDGIGFDNTSLAPWGNSKIGKGAYDGGNYNNIRIPFYSSIQMTCQQPEDLDEGTYWAIVRGVEGIRVTVGDLVLPLTTRLRVYKRRVMLNPLEKLDIVDTKQRGLLYYTTLVVGSTLNLNFLEGCFRAYIDNNTMQLLSSGTEDYFDSAYYFDAGTFAFETAGMTYLSTTHKGEYSQVVSMFKFHDSDPIIWKKKLQVCLEKWRHSRS